MRYAFIMGSNGPSESGALKYARSDAIKMKECLTNRICGFEVHTPQDNAEPFEIKQQLNLLADKCRDEDELICYFSGHGVLHKGALFLLWDNTSINSLLATALPVADIMQALRYCQAKNRLLILDCCHAGAIVNMAGLKDASELPIEELQFTPENYLVLMASGRLEKARELDQLKGSFLTTSLISALSDSISQADHDKDGKVSITDLMSWLEDRTKLHNRRYRESSVPLPYLFGQRRGDFFLTLSAPRWSPYEIPWPDKSTMVVLPIKPIDGLAFCIGKYPVTNAQYNVFVADTKASEPIGENFYPSLNDSGIPKTNPPKRSWQGPFYPWRDPKFNNPNQPVVCVSLYDAKNYCDWINRLHFSSTMLPNTLIWDLAAFGTSTPTNDPDQWLNQSQDLHNKASNPAEIDRSGKRNNPRGISDMIGNIWEWCEDDYLDSIVSIAAIFSGMEYKYELRGGSFLDDLSLIRPFLKVVGLSGHELKHSDLGFRIAGVIKSRTLPKIVQESLKHCPPINAFDYDVQGMRLLTWWLERLKWKFGNES